MTVDLAQPSNLDAECQVLGAVMHHAQVLDDLALTGEDFYQLRNGDLYNLLRRQHTAGNPTDSIATNRALASEPIRGVDGAYLSELYGGLVTAANAEYYASLVREAAELRSVQQAGMVLSQAGVGGAEQAKTRARTILDALDTRDATSVVRASDLFDRVIEVMESGDGGASRTPWPELDEKITGLRPGEVITVGARTGQGKSVVGLNMAWHTALSGQPAVVFSVEMSNLTVMRRLIAMVAEIDLARLLKGRLHEVEWQRVAKARDVIDAAPLFIDERSSLTPSDVRATVRSVARKAPVGCVVVDYVQLMSPDRRVENRQQEVSECSRALKILAGDLGVPVVMLSQLNRNVENRMDKRPVLADLRESGSLEQDSDVVLLLHRDEESTPDVMDVGVAKNRNGPRTSVRLVWEGHYQRVVSPSLSQGEWR